MAEPVGAQVPLLGSKVEFSPGLQKNSFPKDLTFTRPGDTSTCCSLKLRTRVFTWLRFYRVFGLVGSNSKLFLWCCWT